MHRIYLWIGVAALAIALFVIITHKLLEGDVNATDQAILLWAASVRTPLVTAVALDITALGSITLVVLFSAFSFVVLIALRDRAGALQLFIASAGAAALTLVTKDIIERSRPLVIPRLIEVSGFSYPSGHTLSTTALYLTIGIVAGRHVRLPEARVIIFLALSLVLLAIGSSRVYLGVHYPSDVAGGLCLGTAWALILAGFFAIRKKRPA